MFQKLFDLLVKYLGTEAEKATEAAILNGAQRGARNAMLKLTGGAIDPLGILTVEPQPSESTGRLESEPEEQAEPQTRRKTTRKG